MEKPTSATGHGAAPGLASRLKDIDGFDFDEALGMALDRVEFLEKMLRLFLRTHGEDAARLRQLLDAGNHADIGRLAHGLKGAAATIGARRVAKLADRVQSAVRDSGEAPVAQVTQLAQEADQFITAIQGALGSAPDS